MNNKRKGSQFEREVCKKLSLWITHGRKSDVFWRSAISGGRATIAHQRGREVRQCGDITAVSPEGHSFTDRFFVECKHVRDLGLLNFLLNKEGKLAKFWDTASKQANDHRRAPMLIAKQNHLSILLLVLPGELDASTTSSGRSIIRPRLKLDGKLGGMLCDVYYLDDLLGSKHKS